MHAGIEESEAQIPASGTTVDPDVGDVTAVLGAPYAACATEALAAGAHLHYAGHVDLLSLTEGWADLMFGRLQRFAVQQVVDLRPDDGGFRADVDIRVADAADLDVVVDLMLIEVRHRSAVPQYSPPDTRSLADLRASWAGAQNRGTAHLLARSAGRDVGLLSIAPAPEHHRLMREDAWYIGPTAVRPEAHGSGIGLALVHAARRWTLEHGSPWLAVSFNPPTLVSRPFWQGSGFTTTGHVQPRAVDRAFSTG